MMLSTLRRRWLKPPAQVQILPAPPQVAAEKNTPSNARKRRHQEDTHHIRDVAYGYAVLALGAKLAAADGAVNAKETQAIAQLLDLPKLTAAKMEKLLAEAVADPITPVHYAGRVMAYYGKDRPRLELLVDQLFTLAGIDAPIHAQEMAFMTSIATKFGLTGKQIRAKLYRAVIGEPETEPYAVLKLQPGAKPSAIKAAYRQLMQNYHPDKTESIREPMVREVFALRFDAVRDAYETICKERKIK